MQNKIIKKPVPEKDERELPMITEKYVSEICEYNGGYKIPEYNYTCYLHFRGFSKIENLDAFKNLTVLYLENNNIQKIENLHNLPHLVCLYLQNNLIMKIENLENNKVLATLNLSSNKIKKIENLHTLPNLENLYLQKNFISSYDDIENLLQGKNISLIDLQYNSIPESENIEKLFFIFNKMPKLKVLYFKGNDIIKNIQNYRRKMIAKLTKLTYLDDRPIKEEDRAGAIAYLNGGGYKAEKEARKEVIERNDKVRTVRERERIDLLVPYDVKREKALTSLTNECQLRKEKLLINKNSLIEKCNKSNFLDFNIEIFLFGIDYQLYENELFRANEENLITLTISKRERADQECNFIYENWMDEIVEVSLISCCFDFERALKLIHLELEKRNVKNWLLFSELDLRNKWNEIVNQKYEFNINSDEGFVFNFYNNRFTLKIEDVFKEDEIKDIYNEHLSDDLCKEIRKKYEDTKKEKKMTELEKELEKNKEDDKGNGIKIEEGDISDDVFKDSKKIFDSEADDKKKGKDVNLEELD